MNSQRQINYAAFIILMITTAFNISALWGVLFIYWTLSSYYSGQTFLVSQVTRADDPMLFWSIQFAWVALGVYMIIYDLSWMI